MTQGHHLKNPEFYYEVEYLWVCFYLFWAFLYLDVIFLPLVAFPPTSLLSIYSKTMQPNIAQNLNTEWLEFLGKALESK